MEQSISFSQSPTALESNYLLLEVLVRRHLQLRPLVVLARVEQVLDASEAGVLLHQVEQRLQAQERRRRAAGLQDEAALRDEHRTLAENNQKMIGIHSCPSNLVEAQTKSE